MPRAWALPANDRILELRGLLQRLTVLTRGLGPTHEVEDAVGVGRELWRMIDTARKALDTVKDRMRAETPPTPGMYTFYGPDGTECKVQVPPPIVVIRKGAQLGELQDHLGIGTANTLFEVTGSWKPGPDFPRALNDLSDEHQKIVLGVVDTQTPKPRVTFLRRKP